MALETVRKAKARHEADLLRKPNVVGVGVGKKVVGGEETDELCVVVLVRKKVPEAQLQARERVPSTVDDVKTDVVETGELEALGTVVENEARARTDRWRPAPGGVSVGHLRVTAGTLGTVAYRGTEPFILSNAHVLAASGEARRGDPILQPAALDGGRAPEDTVARLTAWVPLHFARHWFLRLFLGPAQRNRVDAALARPSRPEDVTDRVLGLGTLTETAEPTIDQRVRKSGRTTGLTEGRIVLLDATVAVRYGTREAAFEGQIVTTPMSQGGDSGSVVVDDAGRGVGLLFAGSDRVTLANPLTKALDALAVRLVPGTS